MTHRPDVEFLGYEDNADEDLPQESPARRRWVFRVGAAAAVVVAALAVIRAAADHPHEPVSATKTVVAPVPRVSAPYDPGFYPHRDAVEAIVPKLQVPPTCPAASDGQAACTTTHRLPKAFLAAVRVRFPGIKTISTVTQVVRPTGAEVVHALWSRQFTGAVGLTIVHVVVSAGVEPPLVGSTSYDDGISVRSAAWHRAGSLAVQVFASGPSGHDAPLTRLDLLGRLSRDPRLARIS